MLDQLKDEINERIPKKTQKILIYLISVLILVVAGLWIFRPLYTSAMTTQKEVEKLDKELSSLKDMEKNKEQNKKNTIKYETDTKTILAKYPADVFPEDMIFTLSELELATGIKFTDLSVNNSNFVTDNTDKTSKATATNKGSSNSSSSNSTSSSTNSSSSTANSSSSSKSNSSSSSANSSSSSANSSSSSNSSAKSNSSSNSSSANSSSSSNTSSSSSNASKSNSTNSTNSTATGGNAVVTSEKYDLYATPVDCAFEVSYIGIKQLFSALFSSPLKKNVENVTLTFDEETGHLLGTMTINFYSLQYKDNPVNGHVIMPEVNKGSADIFHSIN